MYPPDNVPRSITKFHPGRIHLSTSRQIEEREHLEREPVFVPLRIKRPTREGATQRGRYAGSARAVAGSGGSVDGLNEARAVEFESDTHRSAAAVLIVRKSEGIIHESTDGEHLGKKSAQRKQEVLRRCRFHGGVLGPDCIEPQDNGLCWIVPMLINLVLKGQQLERALGGGDLRCDTRIRLAGRRRRDLHGAVYLSCLAQEPDYAAYIRSRGLKFFGHGHLDREAAVVADSGFANTAQRALRIAEAGDSDSGIDRPGVEGN